MLKDYLGYRERMKPKIKVPAGAIPSRMQKLFNSMDQIQSKIFLVDLQSQSPEDRETFVIALKALKRGIETKIAKATQVTSAGESGSESSPKLA